MSKHPLRPYALFQKDAEEPDSDRWVGLGLVQLHPEVAGVQLNASGEQEFRVRFRLVEADFEALVYACGVPQNSLIQLYLNGGNFFASFKLEAGAPYNLSFDDFHTTPPSGSKSLN